MTFIRIQCTNCSNKQKAFTKASQNIHCLVCDELLAQSTGGQITLTNAVKLQ